MMLGLGLALGSARVQTLLTSVASVLDQLYIFKPGAMYSSSTGGDLIDTPSNANLVVNGDFSDGLTGWISAFESIVFANEELRFVDATSGAYVRQNGVVVSEKRYDVTIDIKNYVEGALKVRLGSSSTDVVLPQVDGTHTVSIDADGEGLLLIALGAGTNLTVDNVIIKDAGGESIGAILDQSAMAGQDPQAWLAANGITDISTLTTRATQPVDADRPTYIKDESTNLARFNGSNYELQIPNIGQTYVCMAVRSTDNAGILLYGDGIGEWAGFFYNGNTSTAISSGAGSPSIFVDLQLIETRDDFHTYACDGEWHIVEIVGADFSTWGDTINIGAYTSWEIDGDIGPIVTRTSDPSEAERQIIRNAAQAAAEGRL